MVTAGPGLTNIVTALAGAYLESRELLRHRRPGQSLRSLTLANRRAGPSARHPGDRWRRHRPCHHRALRTHRQRSRPRSIRRLDLLRQARPQGSHLPRNSTRHPGRAGRRKCPQHVPPQLLSRIRDHFSRSHRRFNRSHEQRPSVPSCCSEPASIAPPRQTC